MTSATSGWGCGSSRVPFTRLGQLTAALAGEGRPGLLADQLSLVMEGTYASVRAP